MMAVAEVPVDTAAAKRLGNLSPYYNALMRTTCVATMLSGGHANNALPQTAKANINCRMLPDDNAENVLIPDHPSNKSKLILNQGLDPDLCQVN
jgi:acetylornithine deacetylase/succinyl-diaminopimelate desuccinylase-like protein